jgi:hypothetical protein
MPTPSSAPREIPHFLLGCCSQHIVNVPGCIACDEVVAYETKAGVYDDATW